MTDIPYLFDGQPSGTAITASTSGGNSGATLLNLGSPAGQARFDAAAANTGQCGLLLLNTAAADDSATGAQVIGRWPFPSASPRPLEFRVHDVITIPDLPVSGAINTLFAPRHGSGYLIRLIQRDTGGVVVADSTAAYAPDVRQAGSTSTLLILTPGKKYRVKLWGNIGAAPNQGSWGLKISEVAVGSPALNNTAHASSGSGVTTANLNNTSATSVATIELTAGAAGSTKKISAMHDELILGDVNAEPADYAPSFLDLVASDAVITLTGMTKVGSATDVVTLSDNDAGTYFITGNNPVGSKISVSKCKPLAQPATGSGFALKPSGGVAGGTGTAVAKLFAAGSNGSLLATSSTATLPTSEGQYTIAFPASAIDNAISAAQWASGLRLDIEFTAA